MNKVSKGTIIRTACLVLAITNNTLALFGKSPLPIDNAELEAIPKAIEAGNELLNVGGRMSIISFHSLEDRLVKNGFQKLERPCTCPSDFPICVCGKKQEVKIITKKPILPSEEELEYNSRSHSAKLRVCEKV